MFLPFNKWLKLRETATSTGDVAVFARPLFTATSSTWPLNLRTWPEETFPKKKRRKKKKKRNR